MPRYRLRTLMIVSALGPPAIAVLWWLGLLPIVGIVAIYAVSFWLVVLAGEAATLRAKGQNPIYGHKSK
jgi:hypothetical protein